MPPNNKVFTRNHHRFYVYPFLAAFCKNGVLKIELLKKITCKFCKLLFCVCRRCWRGQVYCCASCRKEAQRLAHRKAQQKYRQTPQGKEAHRLSERRRRLCKAGKKSKKSMADRGSTPRPIRDKLAPVSIFQVVQCLFCGVVGQIVDHFPRRGYGRREQMNPKQQGEM